MLMESSVATGTQLTWREYQRIEHYLPRPRGNVHLSNLQVLNAILYVVGQGCAWRALPAHFGPWNTVYARMNRWARNGVLERVFAELQRAGIVRIRIETALPDGAGDAENAGAPQEMPGSQAKDSAARGSPGFIWLPRMPDLTGGL